MCFLQVYKSEEVNRDKFSGFCNMSFDSSAVAQAQYVEKSHVQNPKQSLEEHDRISPSGCQPKMGKILFISLTYISFPYIVSFLLGEQTPTTVQTT